MYFWNFWNIIPFGTHSDPTIVWLDDSTLKKWHNYGSLLIDFQTRKIIDLLPYRSQAEVSRGLQQFSSLTYVIRDGSQAFRNTRYDACPDIIQISNHFQVLKSLIDHAIKAVRKLIPPHITTEKKERLGVEFHSNCPSFSFRSSNCEILLWHSNWYA